MAHYLDNSATTKPSPAAVQAAQEAMEVWGNPSSVHGLGLAAKDLLKKSRRQVEKTLGMANFSKDLLIFTSCGTEANSIAMTGCARAKKRSPEHPGTIILSAGEHPSMDEPAKALEKEGYAVVRVPTSGGKLDLDFLADALENAESPVIFAGFMLVNNETGALYDVKSAASLVKRKFPDAVVHCDAVQGYMKTKFTPKTLGVDTLTLSAHKIHSIRGAGALYISAEVIKRKNIVPVMPGGGQENGFRSGTENLVSIAAFGAAAEEEYANLDADLAKVKELRASLNERLGELDVQIKTPAAAVDHIVNITLPGIRSETMLNYLSAREIYVSAGSACAANSKKKSAALEAFGASQNEIDSSIRISLSHTNTADDVDALCTGLADGIAELQRKR